MVHRLFVGMRDNDGKEYLLKDLESILDKYYDGYTLTQGLGHWKGQRERCYIVDLFDCFLGFKLIDEIKRKLNQECVLVQSWKVEGGFE